jgi:hypothetical protein
VSIHTSIDQSGTFTSEQKIIGNFRPVISHFMVFDVRGSIPSRTFFTFPFILHENIKNIKFHFSDSFHKMIIHIILEYLGQKIVLLQ